MALVLMDTPSQDWGVRCARWIGFLALVAVAVVGCGPYTGPDADYFGAVLDEFTVPAGWVREHTYLYGPDEPDKPNRCEPPMEGYSECPRASTTYVADGDPVSLFRTAEEVVEAAGFSVDHTPNECSPLGSDGVSCSVYATRGGDLLWVQTIRYFSDELSPKGVHVSFTATHR